MISLQHLAGVHCRFLATSTNPDCSAKQSWSVAVVTRSHQGWYSSVLGNERRQRSTPPAPGFESLAGACKPSALRLLPCSRLLPSDSCNYCLVPHTLSPHPQPPESRHTKPRATVKSGTRRRSLPCAKLVWPLLTALLCDDRVVCDLQRKSIVCGTAGRPCADLAR